MTIRPLSCNLIHLLPHGHPNVYPAVVGRKETGWVTLEELKRCKVLNHPDPWVAKHRSRRHQRTDLRSRAALVFPDWFLDNERSGFRITDIRTQLDVVLDVDHLLRVLDQRVVQADTERCRVFRKVVDHRPLWERQLSDPE
ncbi:hypothetical protein D3C78_1236530 [compost metagenome]